LTTPDSDLIGRWRARARPVIRAARVRAKQAKFLAAVAAVFALMALAVMVREVAAVAAGSGPGPGPAPVEAVEVASEAFADVIAAVGTARANESVAVTAKVTDVISRINFESGDFVEADHVLAELVDTEQAAALSEARATLSEARRERARINELVGRGVAPASRGEEAQANFERARAQTEAEEARVADRLIRAPFAGVVGLRRISAGELISSGTVVATLNDVSVIKLDFRLPERFVSSVEIGQTIGARSAAWPDEIFHGAIVSIDNQIDPVSRTVEVRAEIDNEDARLVPGMLMTVDVRRNERTAPAIPEAALMRFGEQAYVYVMEPADDEGDALIAVRRDVRPGLRHNGRVEVLEGLSPGDLVISAGVHRVRDGAPVRRVNGADEAQGEAA
jgi:membrane fusion protein (multidrug efflux system)